MHTFVNSDPVVGRYMVAARDIEAGEVIFNDEPACIGESAVKRWPCKAALSKTLLPYKWALLHDHTSPPA